MFRTALLLTVMTAVLLMAGDMMAGPGGMRLALLLAATLNLGTWFFSDRLALALHGARPADDHEFPGYRTLVARLAAQAGLPTPKVYVVDDPQPNAFATGRNPEHAAVAATTGLLETLDARELSGVLGHELAHIKNRDTLIASVTATMAGAVGMLARWPTLLWPDDERPNFAGAIMALLTILLAPLIATLIQMAVSRSREYEADRLGAAICGDPAWLADALGVIADGVREQPSAAANRGTAHLFIVSPFAAGGAADELLSTHPSTARRIERLRAMRRTDDLN